ncbi:MAG: Na+/H+ antiporter [Puia sp.]|nr:Na+/H+ antiporter [Puia sp.]
MIHLSPLIFIVATLTGLSVIAGRIKLPYPILLVLAGLVIGFVPGLPVIELQPDMVFLIFLPPLLYRAAWNTSWRDFRSAIRPISRLAVGLVLFTTVAVAAAAHYYLGLGWSVAFVLGAIVSPPDAVAATSILQNMGLDKRIVTILNGESLVNDASALIAYRYAVAAVLSSGFVLWKAGLQFLLVSSAGILIGLVIGYILAFILRRIKDNPMVESSLSLMTPFIAYPVAEHAGVSGVLAAVSAGLVTSWMSPKIFSYQGRNQTKAIWDMLGFLLNGIIFILIGVQLSHIAEGLEGYKLSRLIGDGLIITVVAILVRLLFIAPVIFFPRFLASEIRQPEQVFNWKNVLVMSWSGMRGVVSLATAMALPQLPDGNPFPDRNIILFITFAVILFTLLGQGLTLPLLIRWLKISPSANEEEEERKLRLLVINSSLDYINDRFAGKDVEPEVLEQVKKLYLLRSGWLKNEGLPDNLPTKDLSKDSLLEKVVGVQLDVTSFKRELLLKLYREGSYSADNIKKLERELDFDESRLQSQL